MKEKYVILICFLMMAAGCQPAPPQLPPAAPPDVVEATPEIPSVSDQDWVFPEGPAALAGWKSFVPRSSHEQWFFLSDSSTTSAGDVMPQPRPLYDNWYLNNRKGTRHEPPAPPTRYAGGHWTFLEDDADRAEEEDDEIPAPLSLVLMEAEREATPLASRVLAMGRHMALDIGEILRGACWHYANAVYERAGFPDHSGKRRIVFKGTKKGPYADPSVIQPGDWLYYVNLSYRNIEHSAIFVSWVDQKKRKALMLSYSGGRRREPGRYLTYDLSKVYQVMRPSDS